MSAAPRIEVEIEDERDRDPVPLWQRALLLRATEKAEASAPKTTLRPPALLALQALLAKTGVHATIVEITRWGVRSQGAAYVWAQAWLAGAEDLPAPACVDRRLRRVDQRTWARRGQVRLGSRAHAAVEAIRQARALARQEEMAGRGGER